MKTNVPEFIELGPSELALPLLTRLDHISKEHGRHPPRCKLLGLFRNGRWDHIHCCPEGDEGSFEELPVPVVVGWLLLAFMDRTGEGVMFGCERPETSWKACLS